MQAALTDWACLEGKDSLVKNKTFVVSLGKAAVEDMAVVEAAAAMAGADVVHETSIEGLAEWMVDAHLRPIAVVMPLATRDALDVAVSLRGRYATVAMPLLGLAPDVRDIAYEEAFTSGFDDICGRDARQLGRRLRHLAEIGPSNVRRSDERIVVADTDRRSRLLIGRVFRDAGYGVTFAADAAETVARATDPRVRVVICSADLECGSGEPLSRRAAQRGGSAAWIVNTPPKQMPDVRARMDIADGDGVAIHDAFACPATLLFIANELVNRPAIEGRKSERLLYGTTVRFRHAGRGDTDVGYLYNISGGGLYVRTLAPPARWDELWLEFTPPRCDRIVHLEGTAVWARRYGPASSATVPCGFGVQITGGSKTDMLRYGRSYRTFLAERMALRRRKTQFPLSAHSTPPTHSVHPAHSRPPATLPPDLRHPSLA